MDDPSPIRDKIEVKIGELFELNQKVATVLRMQAQDFETIGHTFASLSQRSYEIVGLIAELAVIAASNTGDIIMAQFGIPDIDEDDKEEDDDEG